MVQNFDVISIGDSTVDVFLEIDNATVLCELHKKNCQLCVNYADKIPVKKVTTITGVGNSANFAVGASRLGLTTGFYTILGDDQNGHVIKKQFLEEGVSDQYIVMDKNKGTNYSAVISFKGERTILVFHEDRSYKLPDFGETKWIYYSSLAKGHVVLHEPLIHIVISQKIKLGFNPGTFQLKEGLEILKPIIAICEVFIVNKEEAQRLVGMHDDIKKLLQLLKECGSKIVVITDGRNGSYAYDGTQFYFQDIFEKPGDVIVDRTGCGDAFSTGFICALSKGLEIKHAMKWGTMNAASVIQYIGAQEGLLTLEQIKKIVPSL